MSGGEVVFISVATSVVKSLTFAGNGIEVKPFDDVTTGARLGRKLARVRHVTSASRWHFWFRLVGGEKRARLMKNEKDNLKGKVLILYNVSRVHPNEVVDVDKKIYRYMKIHTK